jgi:TPR repeat protein
MLRTTALALVLASLVAVPATAQDYEKAKAAYKRGEYAAALKAWRPLAAKGHAGAQFSLGALYDFGRGVSQDYAEAVKWYRKAAEQGEVKAQSNLGAMYASGQGVKQDFVLAHMWLSLAAANGDKASIPYRDLTAKKLNTAQIAEAQKLARAWRAKHKKK